jgi:pimeloyl-ACP methyl ester carboxylesterase
LSTALDASTMTAGTGSSVEAGYLRDRHPYYRLGSGATPLVVLPGLSDAFKPLGVSCVQALLYERYYFRRFAADFTVSVLGRPYGLPAGYDTDEMAAEYADAIAALGYDSVACLGISMGGLIAQHLAVKHNCVSRLVLSVAGRRLGDHGKRTIRRWRDWAAEGEWFRAVLDGVPESYTGYRRWCYGPFLRAIRPLLPTPASEADIVTAAQAALAHDTTGSLGEIDVPTLAIGGTEDTFFPPEILRETAAGIPESRLELIEGVGHGGYEERPRVWNAAIERFLRS